MALCKAPGCNHKACTRELTLSREVQRNITQGYCCACCALKHECGAMWRREQFANHGGRCDGGRQGFEYSLLSAEDRDKLYSQRWQSALTLLATLPVQDRGALLDLIGTPAEADLAWLLFSQ